MSHGQKSGPHQSFKIKFFNSLHLIGLLLINWQHKEGPRVCSQAGSCVSAQAGDTALGQGLGTATPCPKGWKERASIYRGTPWDKHSGQ